MESASLKGAPSGVSVPRTRGTGEALDQREASNLVQRRASCEAVESASLKGVPSSISQWSDLYPRHMVLGRL